MLREHYGWAGPQFIQYVQTLTPQRLRQRYQMLQRQILDGCDTSEKQAASMAALLLADDLACESIFAGLEPLQVEEVTPYLQRSKEIDAAEQAFAWCCGWIASNPVRFQQDQYGELWGRIADDGSYAMVNKNILPISWSATATTTPPPCAAGTRKAISSAAARADMCIPHRSTG